MGLDYSPASIVYAVRQAEEENLSCTYLHQDIRAAEYGTGFGLVMLIYGEFNVFRSAHIRAILQKARRALADDGLFSTRQLLTSSDVCYILAEAKKPVGRR